MMVALNRRVNDANEALCSTVGCTLRLQPVGLAYVIATWKPAGGFQQHAPAGNL